jgi:alpha-galactosidase
MSSHLFHLRAGGTAVVVDASLPGMPAILHWGPELGPLGEDELASMSTAAKPQRVSGGIDHPARLTILPQEAQGWQLTPGLSGHRSGTGFTPDFQVTGISGTGFSPDFQVTDIAGSGRSLTITAEDPHTSLRLSSRLEVTASGLFKQQHMVTNTGDGIYDLDSLALFFPLPADATEVLDTTGRHLKERSPQRRELTVGAHVRESRRGRPGADASLLMAAGTKGFGFRAGRVHAVHLAWSGNHRLSAERSINAQNFLTASELLLPGEMRLQPGESYSTPWAIGSWGNGLDELAARFHDDLRARPHHPRSPRPVTMNSWEAVYFDHDLPRLKAIATAAAAAGVERFVLDDGWFLGRRDDTAGLGDWIVDSSVWPEGLGPIIDHVRGLGMQFGLWFEPEMVNPDSELARSHPEWMLRVNGRMPVSARQQQVLNLALPAAWDYIFKAIHSILDEYPIDYIKWDHNRDLLDAGNAASGQAAVHANTHAVYRLMEALKEHHPGLEIESCASGGARVDLGVLDRTDRIWTSDCIDPLERLDNQAYTGLLVPYELMGAHIGGPASHSTRRSHSLDFRAATALFGHYGIEWDISGLPREELAALRGWVDFHKANRSLFHTGRSVHSDHPDPSTDLRGVVAEDHQRAVFIYTQRSASVTYPSGAFTLPGLDPDTVYSVALTAPLTDTASPGQSALEWAQKPVLLSGRVLETVGLQAPVLFPETAIIITADSVGGPAGLRQSLR